MDRARKVTLCCAALLLAVAGAAQAGQAQPSTKPRHARNVRDVRGQAWVLNDWAEGTRPYPKDLKKREAAYRKKWGEMWSKDKQGKWSPGTWKWEEFVVIPNGKKAVPILPRGLSGNSSWGKSQALVYAPGGGARVTAVYALARFGIYHVEPKTKEITYVGWMPGNIQEIPTRKAGRVRYLLKTNGPPEGNLRDGLDSHARMEPTRNSFGGWAVVDPVTGRIFFAQKTKAARGKKVQVLRYVEKLLPYKMNGREMLLPAFLDHGELYKELSAQPVRVNGKRPKPRFAVRTTPVKAGAIMPGQHPWGLKILIAPDGRSVLVEKKPTWPPTLHDIHWVEIETGRDLGPIKLPARLPSGPAADGHYGICSRYDGKVYQCHHTGSMGGPGRMYAFDPRTGKVEILYDSMLSWPPRDAKSRAQKTLQKKLGVWKGGPADAATLLFETTCFQFQGPRTGAILNGGWDAAGIRRYHDGFVTVLFHSSQMAGPGDDARPEFKGQHVANFGSLQSCPDIAPNGDVYLTDCQEYGGFPGDAKRIRGIRIVHLWRTDWPKEQPLNGYANRFLSPEKRRALMIAYAKRYIAGYAKLERLYRAR